MHGVCTQMLIWTTLCCRQILKEIIEKKEGMGDMMKQAFFSLTEAVYSAGDSVKNTIFDNVETATIKVNGGVDNVSCVSQRPSTLVNST
jgi:V-type H+-transporting ATPase subunit D